MKTALFTNFSNEPFTGYWDGKPKTFQPGQSVYMPDYLAQHFAKHLTNRELIAHVKDGEKMTSPKNPEQVSQFMELFNKAYIPDTEEQMTIDKDPIDVQIEVANRNRQPKAEAPKAPQDPTQPQVVLPPDFDDEEDQDAFQGAPPAAAVQS